MLCVNLWSVHQEPTLAHIPPLMLHLSSEPTDFSLQDASHNGSVQPAPSAFHQQVSLTWPLQLQKETSVLPNTITLSFSL